MNELIEALLAAQNKISHATDDGVNPYFGSTYATLEQVITAVKAPLNEQGIHFQQHSRMTENGVCIETIFYGHGAKLETGPVPIPVDGQDPQAYGSAITYARRYSLSMACGIGHQKDDDAEAATQHDTPKKEPAVDLVAVQNPDNEWVEEAPDEMFKRISSQSIEDMKKAKDAMEVDRIGKDAMAKLAPWKAIIDEEEWEKWIDLMGILHAEKAEQKWNEEMIDE